MPDLTDGEVAWLKGHTLCMFATGRRDGSPQLSLVGYQFDGSQFLLGALTTADKTRNLRRNPRCALSIQDGQGFVVVYGTAALVDDPAEMEKVQSRFGPRVAGPRPAGAPARPPADRRVSILVTPDKYLTSRMTGWESFLRSAAGG
jgi:PPOX class probable F420-dependent enzyme